MFHESTAFLVQIAIGIYEFKKKCLLDISPDISLHDKTYCKHICYVKTTIEITTPFEMIISKMVISIMVVTTYLLITESLQH